MMSGFVVHLRSTGRLSIHPNYGFIKQLEAFAECQYNPCPSSSVYCRWKRHQKRNVTQFLNQMVDTSIILPDKLLLSRSVVYCTVLSLLAKILPAIFLKTCARQNH